jgi:hypothetical protein
LITLCFSQDQSLLETGSSLFDLALLYVTAAPVMQDKVLVVAHSISLTLLQGLLKERLCQFALPEILLGRCQIQQVLYFQ